MSKQSMYGAEPLAPPDTALDLAFGIFDAGASPVVAAAERVGRALLSNDAAALDALDGELATSIRPADVEALAVLRATRAKRTAG